MSKQWLRGLVVLLVTCAAPLVARAQQQYVVVYIELAPGPSVPAGEKILNQLASAAFTAGALRFDVNKEIQRANFYSLIETWNNQAAYSAFLGLATTQALFKQLAQFQIAPNDERDGTLIEAGKTAAAPAHGGEIEVVTHIDIIPTFLTQAQPLIEQFVTASASDAGGSGIPSRFMGRNHQSLSAHRTLRHGEKLRSARHRAAHDSLSKFDPAVHRRALRRA